MLLKQEISRSQLGDCQLTSKSWSSEPINVLPQLAKQMTFMCHSFVLVVFFNQTIPGPWHRFTKSKGQFSRCAAMSWLIPTGNPHPRTRIRQLRRWNDGDDAKILYMSSKTQKIHSRHLHIQLDGDYNFCCWYFLLWYKGRKDDIFLQMGWQNPPTNDTMTRFFGTKPLKPLQVWVT